jgi:hypothetical protein
VRFAGKCLRVFERERLEGVKWQGGCFAQDAVGDWWLCLPVKVQAECTIAPQEEVALIWGLKVLRSRAMAIAWKRVAGRAAMPKSLPQPSAVAISARPSVFIARSHAAGRMPCMFFLGKWSIDISISSSVT